MARQAIMARLQDFIDRLDARAYVAIYTDEKDAIFSGKVYELLADDPVIKEYGQRKVTGIVITCAYVNILIGEK